MKKRMTHLQWIAIVLALLIVYTPIASFYVYADTTASLSTSSTIITTTTQSTTTTRLPTTTTILATTTTASSTTTTTGDRTPPTIGGALLITKAGEEVKYIGLNGISGVDVSVDITESTNPAVNFDLSLVGGAADVPARVCTKSGSVWRCSLKEITLNSATGSITIEVTALDAAGNRAAKNLTKSLTLDTVGPSVTFIGTDKMDGGVSYAGTSKNTIVVKLVEAGAGLSNLDVFLDLSRFNGRSNVRAENCTKSANEWTCYWTNLNAFGRVSGELLPIKVMSSTRDDLGNIATGITEASAVLDKDAPVLLSNITIVSIGASGETNYHQSGDVLVITVNVSDNTSQVSATADLSKLFASGHTADAATCTLFGTGTYYCVWQTAPIKNGYFNAQIKFNFTDFVGNSLSQTRGVEVFGTTAETPNNFGLSVDYENMVPQLGLSRMTLTLVGNYLISLPFYLSAGSGAEVLRLQIDNCTIGNDTSLYTTYFQNQDNPPLARLVTQAGQYNRAEFYFGYHGGAFSSSQINGLADFTVKCNLNIFQKKARLVYSVPEIERFEFPVNLRESAIGGPPGIVVADKIQDMKDDWWTEQKWITGVYKVLDTIEFWCRMSKTIVYMWQNLLTLELAGKAMAQSKVPGLSQLGKGVYTLGCNLYEGFGTIIWAVWFGTKNPGGTKRCGTDKFYTPNKLPEPVTTIEEALAYKNKFNLRYICGWATCEYAFGDLSSLTGGNLLNQMLSGIGGTKAAAGAAQGVSTAASEAGPPTTAAQSQDKTLPPNDANYFLRRYLNIYTDDAINPRNSILLSAASLCLPGVFYHLDKYRQINCKYIVCLQNVTTAGGDISVCDESKSQAWCLTLWGEIFEVLGPARVLGVVSQQIKSLFVNSIPTGLDLIFKSTICNNPKPMFSEKEWYELLFCDVPSVYYTLKDNYDRLAGMGSVFSLDAFKKPDFEDACAEVFGNETESESSSTTTTSSGGIVTVTFGPTTTT